jgi:hypothetical protein
MPNTSSPAKPIVVRDFDRAEPAHTMEHTLDFLNWLRFINAGHYQGPGNVEAMDHAIARMPDEGRMLEIGSFAGLSTNQIGALKRRHRRRTPLVTCDAWSFEGIDMDVRVGGHPVTFREYAAHVRETYARNVRFFSRDDVPATVQMFSDEFFAAWGRGERAADVVGGGQVTLGGALCFCFIDGDHTYGAAKRDFENTDRYLVRGGFVLMDDSGDGVPGPDGKPWGSWQVAKEVEAAGRYELVMKTPNYLFRKR